MHIKPLYTGFRSTTIWRAFILNSIASSIIIVLAILFKDYFDKYKDKDGREGVLHNTWKSIVITIGVTFIATFSAYALMWFTLGYGYGQTSPP